MTDITIEIAQPNRPDAVALIQALDDELISKEYPRESSHRLNIEALMQPNITFVLAFSEGEAVGCGAVRFEEDYAEVKRMYVKPTHQGLGIARLILGKLEALAKQAGFEMSRLETGIYQDAAIKLYERNGYVRRGTFGDYPETPYNIFYEKKI